MSCGDCGHQNAATAKFCAECGARLQRRCPGCGAEAVADAKFCDQCGTALSDGAASTPGPATRAVRKQVTALFADLVGSTAFGERVDPEAARAALTPYFEILQTTVEAHAGTVAKFTGDGVFAVFGIPEVAEDDALRAVAAGRELQRRFGAFAAQVRERHGVELGLRVGINSGELVVGDDDADLVGDVLNTAARLEAACTPGRVMVGEDTWRLTRSTVGYEVLGEIKVKGKAEAIATFQVVESDDAPIEETIPFVGRSDELDELVAAFEHASTSPTLQLVTIVGAPGVGKTRLASELRAAVSARSFDLRFERRGSTTFSPIADLLRAVGDGSAESVDRLLTDHPERDRLAPVLQSFLGHGAARSTEESFWAARRLLEHLAGEQGPQVVVVDDIQWAEPLFWDLLEHLVEWTAAPVLIVALARPELRELRPELARTGDRVAASIALDGLDESETRELAARLLDTDELPIELTDRLPDSTQGNPLFVRELVNMLVDDGTLERQDGRWRLTIDADAIDVPPTIISLLASRVERLPDEERSIIELASVIGTEFDRGTLAALAGDDAPQIGALVDRLRRRDLIEPSGAWSGDHPLYRFHHVLVRDAAYRRLLKERRANLHERVGRHVEEHRGEGDEADVIVAHHFEQVVTYRRELGIADGATTELAEQTVERLRRAADASLSREDLMAAGAYAQRALALVESAAGARDELLLLGCEALLASGDVAGATPFVAELHERAADDRLAAWADCFRAQRWSLTDPDRLAEASDITDAAAARLDELEDPAGVAKARLVRASCLARLGRVGECEQELDLALGAARQAGDRRRTVAVLGAAPLAALWGPSPVSRAGGRCLDVLRLLRITTASPAVEATSIRCQGVLEALRGRAESAREKLEQSRATAIELGLRQGLFETELFAGWVELWAREAAAAEPHLRIAHEGLGQLGLGADAGQAGALLARSLLLQDRIDEAEALAVDAVESAGQNLQTAIASRSVLAEIRAGQGQRDEAEALIAEALETAERTDIVLDHALSLEAAGRVSRATSHHDRAAELLAAKGVTDERPARTIDRRREPASPSPAQLSNRASTVLDRMTAAAMRGDRAALIQCGAPGLITRRHEPMRTDDEHTIEQHAESLFGLGGTHYADSITSRVVATRGHRLCLIRIEQPSGEFDMTLYIVGGCDEQDRVNIWETFGGEQLIDAQEELDRRWVELGGDDDQAANATLIRAGFAERDIAAVRACVTDDMVSIDRRPGGMLDRDADEWASSMAGLFDAIPVWRAYDRQARGRALWLLGLDHPDGSRWDIWIVQTFDGHLGTRTELFELDDLDAARARYDDLAGTDGEAERLRNGAAAVFDRFMDGFSNWDIDAMRALVIDGFHHTIRVADAAVQDDVSFDDMMHQWELSYSWEPTIELTLLATRGVDLALVELAMDVDGFVTRRCIVAESNGHRLTSLVWFGPDQRQEAVDELDRRWAQQSTVATSPPIELRNQATITFLERSGEEWFRDDLVYEVHRRGVGGSGGGRSDYFDTARSWGEVGLMSRSEPTGVRGDRLAIITVTLSSDGVDEIVVHGVVEVDEEARISYIGVWDDQDRTLAETELDRRWRVQQAESADGWEVIERAVERWLDDDEAGWRACYGDDFRGAGREQLSFHRDDVGIDEWTTASFDLRHQAIDVDISTERVAQRGDHWFVSLATGAMDGNDLGWIFVSQVVDGRIRREMIFDPDRATDAIAQADRAFLADLGIADDHPSAFLWPAMYTADAAVFAPRLHDDYVIHDRRGIGWPDLTRDQFLAAMAEIPAVLQVEVPVVHRVSEAGVVFERSEFTPGDATRLDWITVATHADGLIRDCTLFAIDQLDAALAEWEQIERRHAAPLNSPPLTNTADEVDRAWVEARRSGDVESARRILHPDFEGHERLAGADALGATTVGRDEMLAGIEQAVDTDGPPMVGQRTVIAVRGDSLVLAHGVESFDDHEVPSLVLTEVDGGRLRRRLMFRPDQLEEALDELETRRLALGGSRGDFEFDRRFRSAYRDGEPGALEQLTTPDFEAVDHRPLGFGRRDRSAWIESQRVIAGRATVVTRQFIRRHEGIDLLRASISVDGNEVVDGFVIGERRNGRMARNELFEVTQFDEAVARFDELTSPPALPELTNAAERLMRTFHAELRDRRVNAVRELLHPGFEHIDRSSWAQALEHTPVSGSDWIDGRLAATERLGADVETMERRVLAVRGPQLVLVVAIDTIDGNELPYVGLSECLDGRVRRVTVWRQDQLDEALDELDRCWVAAGGSAAVAEIGRRWRTALTAATFDPSALPITDDFTTIDHRPLGLGRRDVDEYVASMADITPIATAYSPRIFDQVGDWVFNEVHVQLDEGGSVWQSLQVTRIVSAAMVENHVFDLDQYDDAREWFDRVTSLAAESVEPAAVPHALVNREVELSRENLSVWPHDADHVDRFFEPGFEWIVRRTGSIKVGGDLTTYLEATEFWTSVDATIELEVLAIRGDALGLKRYTVRTASGDEQVILNVAEIGSTGRWSRIVVFGDDQLDEALDELDRRWADRGDDAGLANRFIRSRTAFATPDLDTDALPFADDFVTIDHRPMGLGTRRLAEFIESAGFVTPTTFLVPRIFDHVGDLTLYEVQFVRDEDDFLWHAIHIARAGEDDLVHENHVFDLDQLTEARATFDRLVADGAYSEQASGRVLNATPNAAWRVAMRFGALIRSDDRDRMAAMTDPDYVIVNHGRLESVTPDIDATDSAGHYTETFTELGFTTRTELVGVRGDDLCLIRYDFTPDDWHIPRLLLFQQQDGMVRRADWYDIEQLGSALHELDRRWLASLDRGLADTWAEFLTTVRGGETDHVLRWRHPFAQYADQRAAPVADLDRVLAASTGIITRVHRLTARGIVYECLDAETSASQVVIAVLGDALAHRVELFDTDDLAAALDRFAELATDRPETLTNDITRLSRRFAREWPRTMPEITNYCEPEFRISVGRRSQPTATGGLREFESWLQYWHDVGATVFHGEVIAIRGQRHSLFRHCVMTTTGDEEPLLIVTKLGESGRWEHQITFDDEQLVDALDELDRTWGDTDGEQVWAEALMRWRAAWVSRDVDSVRRLLSDDFVSIDHRPAGDDVRGPDQFIESLRPSIDDKGSTVPIVEELQRIAGPVALATVTTSSAPSQADDELLVIVELDDSGRCRSCDVFDTDRWHEALARFEELAQPNVPTLPED